MIKILASLLLVSFGAPGDRPDVVEVPTTRCDIGGTARCYTLTPFGELARTPRLGEAFPEAALSK